MIYAVIRAFTWDNGTLEFTCRDLWKLLIVVLFVLFYQFEIGYTAHTYQHWDFHTRNAFYGNLIDYAWPIILPDGREMTYCLAGWLPVTFACKVLGNLGLETGDLTRIPGYLLFAWNAAVMLLVILLGWLILKKQSLLFVLILTGLGGVDTICERLPWVKCPVNKLAQRKEIIYRT